jgi:hypothetical protein
LLVPRVGRAVYACYHAAPGWHHLIARSDDAASLELWVGPGERHYVRLVVSLGPDLLEPVSGDEATRLLPRLRYVVAVPTLSDVPTVCDQPVPAAGSLAGVRRGCPMVLAPL